MAITKATTQNPAGPTHSKLIKLIAIVLLALIVIVGLTVLIIWLTIKPKKLVYYIDEATIHNYHLSKANHLNATYYFLLRAHNPNKKVSIYYDKVDLSVLYDEDVVSRGTINPFHQPKRNETRFNLNLASHDVHISEQSAKGLKVERTSGKVMMELKLKARIRFKVGSWKSRHYHLKVSCEPIIRFSSSSKGFQSTKCDVDI